MRTLIAVCLVFILSLALSGCASGRLEKTVIRKDGSKELYTAKVSTQGLDAKTANLSVYLDPNGINTIEAGSMEHTVSPVVGAASTDMAKIVEMILTFAAKYAAPIPAGPTE